MKTHHQLINPGAFLGFALLTISAQVAPSADYPTTVLSHNPLAYWRLDGTPPAPALNVVSNSGTLGRAGDGYGVMDLVQGEPGIVGNSIRFNNAGPDTTHSSSKVDVPYNSAISRNFPFSVEFWAKPNSLSGTDSTGVCPITSLNNNWYGGANRSGWLFYCNNQGKWNFRLGLTSGYAANLVGTGGNATVGTWQHIVATYDGLTVNLYANGVLIGTATSDASVTGWLPNTQSALRIGGSELNGDLSLNPAPNVNGNGFGHSGNRGWDGWIDEVAVYPTVLDAATVAAHHDASTTNSAGYGAQILAGNPVAYWNMDGPPVIAPNPSTFPVLNNLGSAGAAANATVQWGALTAQSGSGYGGLGTTNQAVVFDGENGSIAVNDTPALHFSGNITLMAWVKPSVQDFYRDILAHGWDDTFQETFLRISRGFGGTGAGDGNYYELGATDNNSYYDAVLFPIPPGDIGNWVFLAGTYDSSSTSWNLYRNGTLVGTVAASSGDTGALDVTNSWSIGSRSDPSPAEGLRFGGSIDEPAIFNTALSAADISTIYNAAQVPPVITEPVQIPTVVYAGSSGSFSVWAEGSPPLSYLWVSNGVPTGVTTTNLTLNNLAAGNLAVDLIVTNLYGAATSSVSFLISASKPLIIDQPVPVSRYIGLPFTFSVTAAGTTPISYQWETNGTAISGATSPTYSGVVSASVVGNYSCILSNEAGISNSVSVPLTAIPLPTAYASVVLGDGPSSYWRFGETNGTVAHDYIGGNDGTYYSVTLGVPGYSVIDPDTAAEFGAVNTYVGDISGTGVNFQGHTNFTLEAWVNGPAGQPDESTIIAKGNGSSGTTATEQFSLDVAGGNYRFFTRGGGNSLYEADAAVGPDGTWQHVVGVYSDAEGVMNIYVNGELSGTGTPRPAGLRASSSPVSIGSKHLGNDPSYEGYFTGTIDEVAVYPVALSDAQVLAHYSAAYGPSLPPTIVLEPVSVTNYVSLEAAFSVGAGGTVPLSYQWNKDGVPIPDATNQTYVSTSIAAGDAGNYSVTITNVNGATNSSIATLTVLPPPTNPPSISGLVLHLPFDNSLIDTTGRGNNGTGITISGTSSNTATPTYVADGALGGALHFSTDTSVTNNSYVTLGLRPDLQFSSNVNFTVAFWIRSPANFALGDLPFICTIPGSTFTSPGLVFCYTYGYGATPYPGGWAVSALDSNGNGIVGRGEVGSINDGNWHHLVHVFDHKTGNVNYLDGVRVRLNKQAGTSFTGATASIDTGYWFTIGQDPSGTYGESGSGDIDDIGVWRKSLAPLEAATIYMAAISNHLSFVAGPPVSSSISVSLLPGNKILLTWPAGTLQEADNANGPYTDATGVTSPSTINITTTQKFYRSKF